MGTKLPDAVVFDLDGVLALSSDAHFAAYQRLFAEAGQPMSRRQWERRAVGRARREVILGWLGPRDDIERLMADKARYVAEHIDNVGITEVPGAIDLLRTLRTRGVPVGVATVSRMATELLAAVGATDLVDCVVDGAAVRHPKPAPDAYQLACQLLRVEPSRAIAVEDSPAGVESARAAGLYCAALTTTHPAQELTHADVVFAGIRELRESLGL